MKKTLNILFGGMLIVLLFSCDKKTSKVDAQVLKQTVQSSQEFKNYQNATKGLMSSLSSGEISFQGVDKKDVDKGLRESKSAEEFAEHCKKAGMKGGEKYAELLFLQVKSMKEIASNYPELRKLTPREMTDILNPSIQIDSAPKL